MIRIVLNGIDLDTSETSLRWESVNSLFEDNALQSDYSFPFILKYSDNNMRALGFSNKADVPTDSVVFPVLLYIDSKSIKSQLIINGTGKNGFNVNIAGGINGLLNSEKKLNELNYMPETNGIIDLGVSFGNMAIYQEVDWKLSIAFPPHYNPNFYGASNPDFNGIINKMDATVGNFLTNTTINEYAFVPFLYIHYILKTIADENGLSVSGTYWNDPELASALLYNNYALDKAEDQGAIVKTGYDRTWTWSSVWNIVTGVLLVSHSPDSSVIIQFSDFYSGCSNIEGNFHNSDFKYYIPSSGDYAAKFPVRINTSAGYPRSAQIQIIYKYAGVETIIGYEDYISTTVGGIRSFNVLGVIESASAGGEIYAKLKNTTGDVFAPNTVGTYYGPNLQIEWTVKYDGQITIYRYDTSFNIMDQYVNLKNHLPDLTVPDFLKAVKNYAQCEISIDWDEHNMQINLAEKIISDKPAVDLTELADPNFEQIFDEKNKGYILTYDFGSNDELIQNNFKPYDKKQLLGEFINQSVTGTIPTGSFIIAKDKNKVMQWDGTAWIEYSDNYYPITVGKGMRERKIELAPMLMTDTQVNYSATSDTQDVICIMPTIKEIGSSILFDLGINPPSLRMVFMRGKITPGTFGGNYIYASSTNYDINGNKCGNYTLKMEGEDGWYKRFLEKIFLAIDNSAVFEYLIILPVSYLKYKGKVQIKNVNYLVKNISMSIGSTIKQSVVKLLKL